MTPTVSGHVSEKDSDTEAEAEKPNFVDGMKDVQNLFTFSSVQFSHSVMSNSL